ncbi:MAG: hypothetical protein EXX96DRAFT_587892 [Benjaminiella poitrasii]|nr:MAG: hypothetical protein EXX96DRAFT_587892 [Benjaminiella poitrasii]
MLPSFNNLPATCELCGQWMPGHSSDCPRSGVHPSQWSFVDNYTIIFDEQQVNDNNNNDIICHNYALFTLPHWTR